MRYERIADSANSCHLRISLHKRLFQSKLTTIFIDRMSSHGSHCSLSIKRTIYLHIFELITAGQGACQPYVANKNEMVFLGIKLGFFRCPESARYVADGVQCTLYNELGKMCNQKDSMMCLVYAISVLIRMYGRIVYAGGQYGLRSSMHIKCSMFGRFGRSLIALIKFLH